jgi:hypothetical protein
VAPREGPGGTAEPDADHQLPADARRHPRAGAGVWAHGFHPAKGRRRRLPAVTPRRTYLDRAEHVAALFEAAGELDREGRVAPFRRALLATLTLAACASMRRCGSAGATSISPAATCGLHGTKTAAADRTVTLLPVLRDELATLAAARRSVDRNALVFAVHRREAVAD